METSVQTTTDKTKNPVAKFEEFFSTKYKDTVFEALEKYPDQKSAIVDYVELEMFDPDLADLLIEKPEEVIKAASKAIGNIDPLRKNAELHIRFENVSNNIPLRFLRSKYIGKLVAVDGIVRKTDEIRPRILKAIFECRSCMRLHEVQQKVISLLNQHSAKNVEVVLSESCRKNLNSWTPNPPKSRNPWKTFQEVNNPVR